MFDWIGNFVSSIFAPFVRIITNTITGSVVGGGIGIIANFMKPYLPKSLADKISNDMGESLATGLKWGAGAGALWGVGQSATALADEKAATSEKIGTFGALAGVIALGAYVFGDDVRKNISGVSTASITEDKTPLPVTMAANNQSVEKQSKKL